MISKKAYIIGVDIGGTKTAVSLWDPGGRMKRKSKFTTGEDPDTVIGAVVSRIDELLSGSDLSNSEIRAIGVSCGGPLDSREGIVYSPPNLPNWNAVPIIDRLEKMTGIKAFLENDANACALAEWYMGAGKGIRNLVFLTFGTGLGAGLILNGSLYRGTSDLAGEVGHIRLADDGPAGYGKRGAWEGFCSGGGLSRMYEDLTGDSASGKFVCDEAENGQVDALQVIARSAEYLGRGLALLIDLLNPECIIIGSIFSRSEELFRERMMEVIEAEALERSHRDCIVVKSALGESLGDTAAYCVALDSLEGIRRN